MQLSLHSSSRIGRIAKRAAGFAVQCGHRACRNHFTCNRPQLNLQAVKQFVRSIFRHQGDCKPFLAEVLYGCAEVIDAVIDYQEPVVRVLEYLQLNCRVLGIVLVDVQLESLAYLLCVDCGGNAGSTLVQYCEDCVIHIVVNKDNPELGFSYEIRDEGVSIIGLAIEEYSAHLQICGYKYL